MRLPARPALTAISASAILLLSAFLAGCGPSSSAASASATPTCPSRPALKTVAGAITTVASGAVTITQADGSTSVVHLDSKTRITKFSVVSASTITAGSFVQVVADTAETTAKYVLITPQSLGRGGGGFGGRGSGTPTARVNRSCFPTRVPGTPGSGRTGAGPGGLGNIGQNLLGGNSAGYQGLRGTVDSVTATKLTFDDQQGQTFSVALTPATMILFVGPGQVSDITQGEKALASGTPTSDGITARNLIVLPAAVSAS